MTKPTGHTTTLQAVLQPNLIFCISGVEQFSNGTIPFCSMRCPLQHRGVLFQVRRGFQPATSAVPAGGGLGCCAPGTRGRRTTMLWDEAVKPELPHSTGSSNRAQHRANGRDGKRRHAIALQTFTTERTLTQRAVTEACQMYRAIYNKALT